jgi:hypothetical protein
MLDTRIQSRPESLPDPDPNPITHDPSEGLNTAFGKDQPEVYWLRCRDVMLDSKTLS